MNKKAVEARRAYKRAWYAKNKEKQKEYTARYWTKQAEKMAAEKDSEKADDSTPVQID